ncbi:MAG: hypothetical protein J3K34DRAFT_516692, partial [Monoraphidium minutum]
MSGPLALSLVVSPPCTSPADVACAPAACLSHCCAEMQCYPTRLAPICLSALPSLPRTISNGARTKQGVLDTGDRQEADGPAPCAKRSLRACSIMGVQGCVAEAGGGDGRMQRRRASALCAPEAAGLVWRGEKLWTRRRVRPKQVLFYRGAHGSAARVGAARGAAGPAAGRTVNGARARRAAAPEGGGLLFSKAPPSSSRKMDGPRIATHSSRGAQQGRACACGPAGGYSRARAGAGARSAAAPARAWQGRRQRAAPRARWLQARHRGGRQFKGSFGVGELPLARRARRQRRLQRCRPR